MFLILGLVLLPYAGIQADEALFADPIYREWVPADSLQIGVHQVPLMLMSYLGTLKTWLYTFLFNRWRPGLYSLRVPMLLAGVITLWLFYRLLLRTAGRWAAAIGCILLATDATYVLTTVYDWGPVALQHLFLVGGSLLVLSFVQGQSTPKLATAFVFFGLAMWDKALASWWLGGLGLATLAVFPREFLRQLKLRNLAIAVLAFCAGAAPLIIYNVRNPLATFSGNARFSMDNLDQKVRVLKSSLEGDGLFGYVVREEDAGPPRDARNGLERASVGLRDALGQRRRSLSFYLFLAALASLPFCAAQARRPIAFALVFLAVTWVQMAFTKDAGGGVHHSVLLFPFPQFIAAVALSSLRAERLRPVALAMVGLVALSNVVVLNQYLAQFIRNGSTYIWTDAITPLSANVTQYRGRHMFAMDWGIEGTLRMLHRGQLTLWNGEEFLEKGDLKPVLALNPVCITHVPGSEITAGRADRLRALAETTGYRQSIRATINDRNGRPIFYVSEFEKLPAPGEPVAVSGRPGARLPSGVSPGAQSARTGAKR